MLGVGIPSAKVERCPSCSAPEKPVEIPCPACDFYMKNRHLFSPSSTTESVMEEVLKDASVIFHLVKHMESGKGIAKIREALHAARLEGAEAVLSAVERSLERAVKNSPSYPGLEDVVIASRSAVAEMKAKRENLV